MNQNHYSRRVRRTCYTLSLLLALSMTAIIDVQAAEITASASDHELAQVSQPSGAERAAGAAAASAAAARVITVDTTAEHANTVPDADLTAGSAGSRGSYSGNVNVATDGVLTERSRDTGSESSTVTSGTGCTGEAKTGEKDINADEAKGTNAEKTKADRSAASPKICHLTTEQKVLVVMVIINAMALIFLAVDAWMRWH